MTRVVGVVFAGVMVVAAFVLILDVVVKVGLIRDSLKAAKPAFTTGHVISRDIPKHLGYLEDNHGNCFAVLNRHPMYAMATIDCSQFDSYYKRHVDD